MALNFNLMNTDLPGQIAGSFQQGYQGAQDRTNVLAQRQQQRQVADMEMQNALRARQDIEARRSAFGATNPVEIANKLRGVGLGEEALKLEQENRDKVTQVIRDGAKSIAMSPTSYKSIFQRVKQMVGVPLDDDEKRYDEAFATGGESAVRQLAAADAGLGMQVFGGSMYDPSTGKVTTPPKERTSTLRTPEELAQEIQIAKAKQRPVTAGNGGGSAPRGYRFTQSGDLEAIPGGPAAAPAVKPMTELQQRKADKERVDELQGVKAAKSTADELEKLTDELAGNPAKNKPPHPGYEKIIGIQANIPSLPGGDAKRAEQKLETFKGKIATFGRQLATQYGKLGNMAVQEWKIVADSIQNINPAAGNLDEQMRDVVRLARDFEKSMQEKYDDLYGNESQQPATPAATGNLSPSEQAELDQLRKKFGK
jgi:hypothetical protein